MLDIKIIGFFLTMIYECYVKFLIIDIMAVEKTSAKYHHDYVVRIVD